MPDLRVYTGPTKLVVAFDIGTTYSGISYCIHEPGKIPDILQVTTFPTQQLVRDNSKIPSQLYYDKTGDVKAAGAEVFTESTIKVALTEGWTKAERWKLYLYPERLASAIKPDDDLPLLPPGKSAIDVLTDFIRYLSHCAKSHIQARHLTLTWSSIEDSIEYIFTHPNGWGDVQQQLYRRAIKRVGLTPSMPEGQSRVRLLTEGEAVLYFCVPELLSAGSADRAIPRGVVVIDAGGWTINLSMFSMTSDPTFCEEIAPPECRLQGSILVSRRAKALLRRKLNGWECSSDEDVVRYMREFDQTTKLTIKNDQEPAYIKVAGFRHSNSRYNISRGNLKLTGEEVTGLFNDSINAIINAFERQQKSATMPITTALLVGGFSTNEWLWLRLRSYFKARKIEILRSNNRGNQEVANGAVLSHVDRNTHLVASQISLATYDRIKLAVLHTQVAKVGPEKTVKSLRAREESLINKIVEKTFGELCTELADGADEMNRDNKAVESLRAIVCVFERKNQCEDLFSQGRINDAAELLLQITTTASDAMGIDKLIDSWLSEFGDRCVSRLEKTGDEALDTKKYDEAIAAYSTALSLTPSIPNTILTKWASLILTRGSVNEALRAASKLKVPSFPIFRAICDVLEGDDRVTEAIASFRQMENELTSDTGFHDERTQWTLGFQRRCTERLVKHGDTAMESQDYAAAAGHFSTTLSLNPADRTGVLVKRSRAHALMQSWAEALGDADEVIKLNASCHQGHERRYAALHGAGLHAEAVEAFDTMLRRMDESPHTHIRRESLSQRDSDHDVLKNINMTELRRQYVDARPTIQRIVAQTVRSMPRVLINTVTGHLYDKKQQAEAFEKLPIYSELASSMTTQLDYARILGTVKQFYQYVMLSHRWECDEPLFQKVKNISVYDLEDSPANTKLRNFCSLVRSLGFQWAWSDTCCVDKSNNVVLQESLVAMFTWYRDSSLTVVYLRGVSSESQLPGDLRRSIWNTRAWTYQEYVAAEIIQFYTEDWKPYLGSTLHNHKGSADIVAEMQRATGISAQEMAVLRPGLDRVREKLYLASNRETTLVEDTAYSLFGIFNVAIPVIYGEGNRAVGRLLEYVLSGSGDVTILAWTGRAGSHNSCLPADLTVYAQLAPPHVPLPMGVAEMDGIIAELRSSLLDFSHATGLYNRLNELPPPSLIAGRLRLPGIVFPLTELHVPESGPDSKTKLRVYRLATRAFGDTEVKTTDDLNLMTGLCFVHPWIRPLLDQEFLHKAAAPGEIAHALRFVARLKQPFGALLFESLSRVEYRRVATDSLIVAQIHKRVSLTELIDSVRTIEIH